MNYEYGYTMMVGEKPKETILGSCDETKVEQMRLTIKRANEVEAGPNIRGLVRPQTTFHFVREK